MGNIIMSFKEKEQIEVFEKLKRKEITQVIAGQMLHMSDRSIRKKLKRYLKKGIEGLLHQNRGKPSLCAWDEKEKAFAVNFFRKGGKLFEFPPSHGAEMLEELFNIKISKETLRKELISKGLWVAGKKKPVHRKKRERKPIFGIMIQLDGSPHDWFEGRGPKCTLLVFIDDATSSLVWLEFAKSESLEAIMQATWKYFKKHGRPVCFYVDYGSVFSVNTNNLERDKVTQFERAMKELGVEVIHARSPQAKGRVERVNQTLQERLTRLMRLKNISTIEVANEFVQNGFLDTHNKKFSAIAEQPGNVHRSVAGIDLYNVFCTKEKRVLQQDFTVSYKNRHLQLLKHQKTIIRPKEHIIVHQHLDGKLSLWIRQVKLIFDELKQRPTRIKNAVEYVQAENENVGSIPLKDFVQDMSKNRKRVITENGSSQEQCKSLAPY